MDRKLKRKIWFEKRAIKIRDRESTKSIRYRIPKKFDITENHDSTVIPLLLKKKFISKIHCSSKVRIEVPIAFEFQNNADTVLSFLKKLVYIVIKPTVKKIFIDHSKTQDINLTTSLIMDIILMDSEKYMKQRRKAKKFEIEGKVPLNTDIGVLLHANGVLPHLGFDVKRDPNVETLDLLFGTPTTTSSEEEASAVLKYYNNCLNKQKYKLTNLGKNLIGKILGEVIDNCKIHAGADSRWYILGFYHNKNNSGKVHLAIVNIGNTIYESLNKKDKVSVTNETFTSLKRKTEVHRKYFNINWDEEMLWTLLSLQDGVSRLRDSHIEKDSNRGKGTIDMITCFEQIGKSSNGDHANFNIISGSTQIVFDFEKYPVVEKDFSGEKRKVISFNSENSIDLPPDTKYVKKLKNKFPGTIITMEFYIDQKYINSINQNILLH